MNPPNVDDPGHNDVHMTEKNHPHPKMWWCEAFYCV